MINLYQERFNIFLITFFQKIINFHFFSLDLTRIIKIYNNSYYLLLKFFQLKLLNFFLLIFNPVTNNFLNMMF